MAYHNIFLDKLRIITDGLNEEYLGGREGGRKERRREEKGGKKSGGREGRKEVRRERG